MKIWSDYYKVLEVIDSCQNINQLKSAAKMLDFWYRIHQDFEIYHKTYNDEIYKKFYNMGGSNLNDLYSEKVTQKN